MPVRLLQQYSLLRVFMLGSLLIAAAMFIIVLVVGRYTNSFLDRESVLANEVLPNYEFAHRLTSATANLQAHGLLLRNATDKAELEARSEAISRNIRLSQRLLLDHSQVNTEEAQPISQMLDEVSSLVRSLAIIRQRQLTQENLLNIQANSIVLQLDTLGKLVQDRIDQLTDDLLETSDQMSPLATQFLAGESVQAYEKLFGELESNSLQVQDYLVFQQNASALSALVERVVLMASAGGIAEARQERDYILRAMVSQSIYFEDSDLQGSVLSQTANVRDELRRENNIFEQKQHVLGFADAQLILGTRLAEVTQQLIKTSSFIQGSANSRIRDMSEETISGIHDYRTLLAGSMVLLVILLAAATYFLVYRLTVIPLSQIIKQLERVGTQRFSESQKHYIIKELDLLNNATSSMHHALIGMQEKDQELKLRNIELKQVNEDLEQFAHVASHDLQEPLRKLRQFSGLLVEEFSQELGEDGRFYLKAITVSSERMSVMIKSTLDYARTTRTNKTFEFVDLNTIVDGVKTDLALLISECDAQVKIERLPRVNANRTGMNQLFTNLITNGIKYRHKERSCLIRITCYESFADQQFFIEVQDNGIGIKADHCDRVFKPFERVSSQNPGGTGLGLAICQKVCDAHNWQIKVVSEEGQGACFIVSGPLSAIIKKAI